MAEKINEQVAHLFAERCDAVLQQELKDVIYLHHCYYDDDKFAIRQFVFCSKYNTFASQFDTTRRKYELKKTLQNTGATNIKAIATSSGIDIAFDIKKAVYRKMCRELGIAEA